MSSMTPMTGSVDFVKALGADTLVRVPLRMLSHVPHAHDSFHVLRDG